MLMEGKMMMKDIVPLRRWVMMKDIVPLRRWSTEGVDYRYRCEGYRAVVHRRRGLLDLPPDPPIYSV